MHYCYRPCCIRNGAIRNLWNKETCVTVKCISAKVSGQYFGKSVV